MMIGGESEGFTDLLIRLDLKSRPIPLSPLVFLASIPPV
jgi:hypothetical protein